MRALADRINRRFEGRGARALELIVAHHEPEQVYEYYRAADFCFVSSLHDGMNLVAKEFVSSRDDERGVLILSQFTGAARELPEAMVVNPYDIDQCAAAIHLALTMPPEEQRERIRLCAACCRTSTSTAGRGACCSTPHTCGAAIISSIAPPCRSRRRDWPRACLALRHCERHDGADGVFPRHRRHAHRFP